MKFTAPTHHVLKKEVTFEITEGLAVVREAEAKAARAAKLKAFFEIVAKKYQLGS